MTVTDTLTTAGTESDNSQQQQSTSDIQQWTRQKSSLFCQCRGNPLHKTHQYITQLIRSLEAQLQAKTKCISSSTLCESLILYWFWPFKLKRHIDWFSMYNQNGDSRTWERVTVTWVLWWMFILDIRHAAAGTFSRVLIRPSHKRAGRWRRAVSVSSCRPALIVSLRHRQQHWSLIWLEANRWSAELQQPHSWRSTYRVCAAAPRLHTTCKHSRLIIDELLSIGVVSQWTVHTETNRQAVHGSPKVTLITIETGQSISHTSCLCPKTNTTAI